MSGPPIQPPIPRGKAKQAKIVALILEGKLKPATIASRCGVSMRRFYYIRDLLYSKQGQARISRSLHPKPPRCLRKEHLNFIRGQIKLLQGSTITRAIIQQQLISHFGEDQLFRPIVIGEALKRQL